MTAHFIQYFLATATFISSMAQASQYKADPVKDLHTNIPGYCQSPGTDIISTSFERVADEYIVKMLMSAPIDKRLGYKEFYFWMDVTHNSSKGYQPYLPHSIAWPDLYADYRIFYSINANATPPFVKAKEKVMLQKCFESNCAQDYGMIPNSAISVDVQGATVTFQWPVELLPELDSSAKIRIGYTTYFELTHCNGEDDSPQWGEDAFTIRQFFHAQDGKFDASL